MIVERRNSLHFVLTSSQKSHVCRVLVTDASNPITLKAGIVIKCCLLEVFHLNLFLIAQFLLGDLGQVLLFSLWVMLLQVQVLFRR